VGSKLFSRNGLQRFSSVFLGIRTDAYTSASSNTNEALIEETDGPIKQVMSRLSPTFQLFKMKGAPAIEIRTCHVRLERLEVEQYSPFFRNQRDTGLESQA
jgi:hypothetical protein